MHFPLQVPLPLTMRRRIDDSRWSLAFLARNRYQLVGAVLFAVIVPALWHGDVFVMESQSATGINTAVGTLFAVVSSAYVLRQLTAFAGVNCPLYVLPVFSGIYGVLIAIFVLCEFDYSAVQVIGSFGAALSWYSFVLYLEQPVRRPCFLVLGGGDAEGLMELQGVEWHAAHSPDRIPGGITGIVADLHVEHGVDWERLFARCALEGLPIYHSKQVRESLTGHVAIGHLSENSLGQMLPSSVYMRFKRLFDITGVLVAAPVAIILALLTAVLISFVDGGPVLFQQIRMGYRGRTFNIYKFRTMRTSDGLAQDFTEEDDPRISRLGRVLRRYRIDEVPQLINILKGDMSWIGPRPESIALSEWYEKEIPFYSYRHIVRPGLTGWAQVSQGNVALIQAATTKLHYDFYYIKHFSFWIELLIAMKTVRIVFTGFGSR